MPVPTITLTINSSEALALNVVIDYVIDLTCKDDNMVRHHLAGIKSKITQALTDQSN